jgi:hypothetical protein
MSEESKTRIKQGHRLISIEPFGQIGSRDSEWGYFIKERAELGAITSTNKVYVKPSGLGDSFMIMSGAHLIGIREIRVDYRKIDGELYEHAREVALEKVGETIAKGIDTKLSDETEHIKTQRISKAR